MRSSAKNLNIVLPTKTVPMLLINRINKIGPMTEPWETPLSTGMEQIGSVKRILAESGLLGKQQSTI